MPGYAIIWTQLPRRLHRPLGAEAAAFTRQRGDRIVDAEGLAETALRIATSPSIVLQPRTSMRALNSQANPADRLPYVMSINIRGSG
jgi:hypothetical protein